MIDKVITYRDGSKCLTLVMNVMGPVSLTHSKRCMRALAFEAGTQYTMFKTRPSMLPMYHLKIL